MLSELQLKSFDEVSPAAKTNLLLGNGFSIGIRDSFRYDSLKEVATAKRLLTDDLAALFKRLRTTDFEVLLQRLHEASVVNSALGIDHGTPLERYTSLRRALIETVKLVHPSYGEIRSEWLTETATILREFRSVFTTNYDLLLYWIAGAAEFRGFTDFFWSEAPNLEFDQFNTEPWGNRTELIYLHGALFLVQVDSRVCKLRRSVADNLLDKLDAQMEKGELPLFVSEGTHDQKINAIRRNPYLTFALQKLRLARTGITIFGQSLARPDSHLVTALNDNSSFHAIAVSLHRGDKTEERLLEQAQIIEKRLGQFKRRGGALEFFDSRTFPLEPEQATKFGATLHPS